MELIIIVTIVDIDVIIGFDFARAQHFQISSRPRIMAHKYTKAYANTHMLYMYLYLHLYLYLYICHLYAYVNCAYFSPFTVFAHL